MEDEMFVPDAVKRIVRRVLPDALAALEVCAGPVPVAPKDYADGFVLPAHCVKPLHTFFQTDVCKRLGFFEGPHIYCLDGVPIGTSVTTLAHKYETPFDAGEMIANMMRGRTQAWPRREYALDVSPLGAGTPWTRELGLLAVDNDTHKTVAAMAGYALNADATQEDAMRALVPDHAERLNCEFFTFSRGMTKEEIEDSWTVTGQLARNKGTHTHLQAELLFNGLAFRHFEPEMQFLLKFIQDEIVRHDLKAFATEKEIVLPSADLAGSIDLLMSGTDGVVHIVDFKRSDKLANQLRGFKKMKAPFTHLDDCNGAKYALQLSLYQIVLERQYGLIIGDRVLLALHDEKSFATSVPMLRDEAEFLIDSRTAEVNARRRVAESDARFRCEASGLPLVEAVTVTSPESPYHQKRLASHVAKYHTLDSTPDEGRRKAFEDAVEAVIERPTFKRPSSAGFWRNMMPESGLPAFQSLR